MTHATANSSTIICLDLEGVLVPEIWHGVAASTGIDALALTTRDIADYDELMSHRLKLMAQHKLTLTDIQRVIASMAPLEGAAEFLNMLRQSYQVIILSDTFEEFAKPLMQQLGMPTIFCHRLEVDDQQRITGYRLRLADQKRQAVEAFQKLNYRVLAAGDSYNDLTMLSAANAGFLFRSTVKIIEGHPQFPATSSYDTLARLFADAIVSTNN